MLEQENPPRTAPLQTSAKVRRVKIMLIADSPWVGNRVKAALDGRADLVEITEPGAITELAEPAEAEAVIVDMQVGSMGGMALVRALRDELPPGAPVIMLLDRTADEFLARRAGAGAWLLKPFTTQDLRAALDAVLPARAN